MSFTLFSKKKVCYLAIELLNQARLAHDSREHLMAITTFSQSYQPIALTLFKSKTWIRDILLVFSGSLILAASAKLSFPLLFSPVPVSAQTLALFIVAASLGSIRGTLAVALYLFEGGIGFPVFAQGAGWLYFIGPTGGYLIGFLPAAYVVGQFAEKGKDRSLRTAIPGFLFGHFIILFFGIAYLSRLVGLETAITLGLTPFIPGVITKTIIASLALPITWKWVKSH